MRLVSVWLMTGVLCSVVAGPVSAFDFEQAARDALANETTSPLPMGPALGIGAYVAGKSYQGEDTAIIAVPAVYYRSEQAFVHIKQAAYRFWEKNNMELSVVGDLRLDSYTEDESDFLLGMKDRNMTIDAGFQFELGTPVGELELTFLTDILFQNEGQEATVAWALPFIYKRIYLKTSLSASWLSSNLADYYCGVRASEATDDRPAYTVDDTWSWAATLVTNYRLAENWLLIGLLQYEGFSDEIKDSPIISEDGEVNVFLGIAYHF
ncbi:MAG: MipA/OmpV family protein [Thermodesulfobacteriota bacterium]